MEQQQIYLNLQWNDMSTMRSNHKMCTSIVKISVEAKQKPMFLQISWSAEFLKIEYALWGLKIKKSSLICPDICLLNYFVNDSSTRWEKSQIFFFFSSRNRCCGRQDIEIMVYSLAIADLTSWNNVHHAIITKTF